MFLVEQKPGQEMLFRSPAELAAAIRSGEVSSEARIYHRTTSTWLPITVHPAYREALKAAARPAPPAISAPLPRKQWTFMRYESEQETVEPPAPPGAEQGAPAEGENGTQGVSAKPRPRFRFWR